MSAARFALVASVATTVVSAIPFDPFFYTDEWSDVCKDGIYQTPINIDSSKAKSTPVPDALVTDIVFPVAKGVTLKNVGNGELYEWESFEGELPTVRAGGDGISAVMLDPSIAIDRELKVQPIQFHFHSVSEHVIDGLYYAAEGHIVTLVAEGEAPEWGCDAVWQGGDPVLEKCAAVFGMMFKLSNYVDTEGEPAFLAPSIAEGPEVVDDDGGMPFSQGDIDLMSLIPTDKSYYTYYGSLTTPPCAEGLRWHVFSEPLTITPATYEAMQNYLAYSKASENSDEILGYRTNERFIQPINGRTIWYHADPDAPKPAPAAGCIPMGDDDVAGSYGDMAGMYGA